METSNYATKPNFGDLKQRLSEEDRLHNVVCDCCLKSLGWKADPTNVDGADSCTTVLDEIRFFCPECIAQATSRP